MLSYSIAIRTLGKAGDKFKQELISISRQTVLPEKVIVYIAEGYKKPDFRIGTEEYIEVKKGMVSQRAFDSREIKSDVILFLDDDVELQPDSAEKMLKAMEKYDADCIGADLFQNHKMCLKDKIFCGLTNFIFPHFKKKLAFRIKKNGSFSYNNSPQKDFYWSQSCAGPAFMLKKETFEEIRFQDEAWMDSLGFAYGDDQIETYKLYRNGFKLGVVYNSGCKNLDAGSESSSFRKNKNYIYIRSKATFISWWRSIYQPSQNNVKERLSCISSFSFKFLWTLQLMGVYSLVKFSFQPLLQHFKGLTDGWEYVHSEEFKNIPPYVFKNA